MSKKKDISGKESFEQYYSSFFGSRWETLKEALLKEPLQVGWNENLLKTYCLDAGSVTAALALPVAGAKNILDMCAAPGGKSLVITSGMDDDAHLTSNERSKDRKYRLLRVLDEHVPSPKRENIDVTGFDASLWCKYEKEAYDRILLDAPCSSERHVLADEKYLNQWSPARIKNLSVAQWSLLSSALLILKQDGYMLYATCALSKSENDDVIAKALKKYGDKIEICEPVWDEKYKDFICNGEKTMFGYHVLPDINNGAGPLFFSLIHKTKSFFSD